MAKPRCTIARRRGQSATSREPILKLQAEMFQHVTSAAARPCSQPLSSDSCFAIPRRTLPASADPFPFELLSLEDKLSPMRSAHSTPSRPRLPDNRPPTLGWGPCSAAAGLALMIAAVTACHDEPLPQHAPESPPKPADRSPPPKRPTADLDAPAVAPGPDESLPEFTVSLADNEPPTIRLGTIFTGQTALARLVLTNPGPEAVTLSDCKHCCGSVAPQCPRGEPIQPGAHATVILGLKSGLTPGRMAKKITLTFAQRAPLSLLVEGKLVSAINTTPRELDPHPGRVTPVRLKSTDETAFRVTGSEPPLFDELPSTARIEHSLELDWQRWKQAGSATQIRLLTDHPLCPAVLLTVDAPPPE